MARVVTSLGIWWWVHFLICVTSSFWYCPMQEVDKNPLAIPWSFTWFLQLPAAKCRSEVQDWMGRAVLERLAGLGIIGLRSEDYFHWLHLSLEFHHRVFCPSMCSKKKHSFLLCFSDGHGSISIGSFERGDEHPIGPAVLVLKDWGFDPPCWKMVSFFLADSSLRASVKARGFIWVYPKSGYTPRLQYWWRKHDTPCQNPILRQPHFDLVKCSDFAQEWWWYQCSASWFFWCTSCMHVYTARTSSARSNLLSLRAQWLGRNSLIHRRSE